MVCSELHTKIGKREETMCVVESLLVFAVTAFYFAVVARCVGANQLVQDPKACSGQLKACEPVLLVGRKMCIRDRLSNSVCPKARPPSQSSKPAPGLPVRRCNAFPLPKGYKKSAVKIHHAELGKTFILFCLIA